MFAGGASTGAFALAQQQAPAAGLAQHVPDVLLKGPVLVEGQSHTPSGRTTATLITPPTVTATRPVMLAA